MNEQKVILKKGKEKALKNRHHWIFSGAISHLPAFENGDILPVFSADRELLGSAYFNRSGSIVGRMVSFGSQNPLESIAKNMKQAVDLRQLLFKDAPTTGYRLINGEGDCVPGLIVDKYADVLVIQISTLGMEKLKSFLIGQLIDLCPPKAIYEKSLLPSRKNEGLGDTQGFVYGQSEADVPILENGLQFLVSITEGQKTGFFLDHREMRKRIQGLSNGKRVLNCFAYTGGFSVYAAQGKAVLVDSVDISEKALKRAQLNLEINEKCIAAANFYPADVFQFLREYPVDYDLVILDPPAFAKKQKDTVAACRGYKEINRLAMEKMPANSILLTCSCSHFVDESLFQKVIFQASVQAKRKARIIGRHALACDHPVNACHPEGEYLKSFLIHIE